MDLLPAEEYRIGIICALPHEMTAAKAMLDEQHKPTGQANGDENVYQLGKVYEHNVVIAGLPAGRYGTVAAASVAKDMLRTFTGLRFGLMVGIGGGIPNIKKGRDIRLGDVVISEPRGTLGGVLQYDLVKNLGEDEFERKGMLNPPPNLLLAALTSLQAEHDMNNSKVPEILNSVFERYKKLEKSGYAFPGRDKDTLRCLGCIGNGLPEPCRLCTNGAINRGTREDDDPHFWYGTIASGNELVKNAVRRDKLGEKYDAICVEMEAAGLMNDFPCLIIRGICDYADSHKNDEWQKYAALTSAAYAKELLGFISAERTQLQKPATEVVSQ